jgi:hypothetical protein
MPEATQPQKRRGWSGTTQRTQENSCMLGAKWWKKDDKLSVLFQRKFMTKFGDGHEFLLVQPEHLTVNVDEFGVATKSTDTTAANESKQTKTITRFGMPPLAGFDMAVQDLMSSGFDGFKQNDRVIIKCVDIQEAKDFGFSDMPMFEISVDPR